MIEIKIKITNKNGIHLRPSMCLTDLANKYKSEITLEKEDKTANAKSIMEVTMLSIAIKDEITIKINGDDEIEAMKAIEELIKNNFNDCVEAEK